MGPQTSKPYELTFEDRNGYLCAHVTASEMDGFAAIQYLSEVASECARTRCERVLIDRDIPTPIDDPLHSSMNVFLGCCRGLKTALVSHHLTAAASIQSVTDLNAGRGIAVAYFDTREKAEQWLLETDHPAYAEIDRRPPASAIHY